MKLALGIESSCDDTAIAIVREDKKILSNLISSQHQHHRIYNGVVPEIASRLHMDAMSSLISYALDEADIKLSDISLIAATGGPGLIGGVIVGTMFAKSISSVIQKPYIPINHLAGHALTARLISDVQFPYLLLLASGGHCQFIIAQSANKFKILGSTLDDAAGEAFDKVAKMLNLGYPGGPEVEKRALKGKIRFNLPLSMCNRNGCDMSFSGLKTAVRNIIEKNKEQISNDHFINDLCASFQYTILEIFKYKMREAAKIYEQKYFPQAENCKKNIVVAGGVAANKYLISGLRELTLELGYDLYAPAPKLCTDNAAMIAWAGIEISKIQEIGHTNLNFCPKARWSLE